MTEIFQRYRTFVLILCLLVLAALAWLIFAKQDMHKIPSRGVFVINSNTLFPAGWR